MDLSREFFMLYSDGVVPIFNAGTWTCGPSGILILGTPPERQFQALVVSITRSNGAIGRSIRGPSMRLH
jgi:hypothetical protein